MPNSSDEFDWLLRSSADIAGPDDWTFSSFAEMLHEDDTKVDSRPLLIGADDNGPLELSLSDLRRTATQAHEWCRQHGFAPGDSLLLIRLPHSSEVPLAAVAIALMSLGIRVVMPMSVDRVALAEMLRASHSRAMLWCAAVADSDLHPAARETDAMFREAAAEVGVPTFSIDGELDWHLAKQLEPNALASGELPRNPRLAPAAQYPEPDREVLVLSTSGSTGVPKLVRYTEGALLRVAEAWNVSGLMSPELTGGRSICPTLSHSMGFRNVLHAVWNRQPTLLAQPEWLEEKPKQFAKLLERVAPQHITCGPALLGDLSLLAKSVRRFRDALSRLQCVVSSGAADANRERVLPEGVKLANAFGMTEVQQVLNTLLGPATQVPRSLGRPLPGVSVAVRLIDNEQKLGRLFVSSPFAARGYIGSPDFGTWFDTGDLVRVEDDDLIWIGRADEDFLNTGLGVKASLFDLRENYRQLEQAAEAVLFVELPDQSGVGAIVYVGGGDPTSADIQEKLLNSIAADHQRMADGRRDFALQYMTLGVIGLAAGRPPKRGPGKIDRSAALADQAELLAAMDDPKTDHPRILPVPKHGSDRPDWRRYA